MGDHFRTGKPPRRTTRYPGQLSLRHPSLGRPNEYPAKAVEVNRNIAWYTTLYPRSRSDGTRKFDHGLSHLLHEELHWLDVPECIQYKLGVTVHHCLQNKALEYLVDCCTPVSDIPSQRHLQSATRHHPTTPRYRVSTSSRWTFSVAGPTV